MGLGTVAEFVGRNWGDRCLYLRNDSHPRLVFRNRPQPWRATALSSTATPDQLARFNRVDQPDAARWTIAKTRMLQSNVDHSDQEFPQG